MNFSKPAENNYSILPEGEYDVIITKAEESVHSNGKPNITLAFTVRNDVEQECRNRLAFLTMWKKREPNADDLQVEGYNYDQLKNLLDAARVTDTDFGTVSDFCKALIGRCVVISIYHEEYNGKTQARVRGFDIYPTKFPECRHIFPNRTGNSVPASPVRKADSTSVPEGFEEIISADDVPF